MNHVFRIPHSSQNMTESQILQNKSKFPPNGCQVSHSGHVINTERQFVGTVVYIPLQNVPVRQGQRERH